LLARCRPRGYVVVASCGVLFAAVFATRAVGFVPMIVMHRVARGQALCELRTRRTRRMMIRIHIASDRGAISRAARGACDECAGARSRTMPRGAAAYSRVAEASGAVRRAQLFLRFAALRAHHTRPSTRMAIQIR